ncbi:MAG: DNA-3-methyladenine glycosylase [Terriglobales bacterium]|jgi:DNA-3-methyladenine glycosylase
MSAARTLLKPIFFNRDPRKVARALLGKLLVRKTPHAILAGRIVETEAYLGENDDAAHAVAGKTARNFVLFGPPGFAYVYFIYGNHYLLNVSCLPDGIAGGVLFRALEPVVGIEEMAAARGVEIREPDDLKKLSRLRQITSGPGRLSEAFGVTRERDNGKNLASARSDLKLMDDGFRVRQVAVTPRIGITRSAAHPLRYIIAGNRFVSGSKLPTDIERLAG